MIGGHNPGAIACVRGETAFLKAGFSATQVARVRLWLDAQGRVERRAVQVYDLMGGGAANIVPDAAVQRAVDQAMAPYRAALNEPLATLPVPLHVDRDGECALGNFFTDGCAVLPMPRLACLTRPASMGTGRRASSPRRWSRT